LRNHDDDGDDDDGSDGGEGGSGGGQWWIESRKHGGRICNGILV
jgi:hypothetical protein